MFAIDIPQEQIAHFCQRWHITEFALFGSVLRDDFRSDSDIDRYAHGVDRPDLEANDEKI